MALWNIRRKSNGARVVTHLSRSHGRWSCGEIPGTIHPDLVLEWIAEKAVPGDLIVLESGALLHFNQPAMA